MARISREDLFRQDPGEAVAIMEALAPLASGVNKDGTTFTLPATGLTKRFRDEFATSVLTDNWDVYTANGATITQTGSNVRFNTGTDANGVAELTSKDVYAPGVRIYAVLTGLSQRIANQEFTIGLVEHTTANNTTGTDRAEWAFSGTTVTTGTIRTWSQSDAGTPLSPGILTTAAASIYEVDLGHEEVWFYNTSADSSSARTAQNRISRKVPDPNKRYKVRITAKNTGVAPASQTTMDIDSVLVEDYAFIPVEITRARGSSAAGEALPVIAGTGGARMGFIAASGVYHDEASTNIAAGASLTGATRDLAAVGSSTQFSSTSTYMKEFRAEGIMDQPGNLHIEVSRDNTTYRRIKTVALAQPGGTGLYYAEIIHLPKTRYARAILTNTGAATTTVQNLNTALMAH